MPLPVATKGKSERKTLKNNAPKNVFHFNFVSYGVGLTKLKWKTFFGALFLSVVLSDLPFVATGSGIRELKDQNITINQIINGDFPSLDQKFLIVFIFSALMIFSIGIFSSFLNKRIIKK